jgi:hypothetical protein
MKPPTYTSTSSTTQNYFSGITTYMDDGVTIIENFLMTGNQDDVSLSAA